MIRSEELALVQGWAETKRTLRAWNRRPLRVVGTWAAGSVAVAVLLLAATWVIAAVSPPDLTRANWPGVTRPAELADYVYVLERNGLVLALHALACVAGFMAGASLPVVAAGYRGWKRWVHDKAGPLAIGFVLLATLFSLGTQAYVLGGQASTLAAQLDMPPALLLVCLLPHALPELTALFLPLAAWTLASRREAWNELLAATMVTVVTAVPVLLAAAAVETWVTPHVIRAVPA
jgi:stage II sporulation SpoM-like protein